MTNQEAIEKSIVIKKRDFGKTKSYSQSDYDCGNCGGATIDINSHFNYCPNCGYSVIK